MYAKINENGRQDWQSVDKRLGKIAEFIVKDLRLKQETIRLLMTQVQEMKAAMAAKDAHIRDLLEKLGKSSQDAEGLRQLMNKLLNDIENYQKDIDWYRRTYEQRSLLGILKDKFFRKPDSSDQ
ncbi:MAG TPA: hypothetical protein VKU83_00500 [Puia sp.]|nr:hypothetical protein [Puia sp.]